MPSKRVGRRRRHRSRARHGPAGENYGFMACSKRRRGGLVSPACRGVAAGGRRPQQAVIRPSAIIYWCITPKKGSSQPKGANLPSCRAGRRQRPRPDAVDLERDRAQRLASAQRCARSGAPRRRTTRPARRPPSTDRGCTRWTSPSEPSRCDRKAHPSLVRGVGVAAAEREVCRRRCTRTTRRPTCPPYRGPESPAWWR